MRAFVRLLRIPRMEASEKDAEMVMMAKVVNFIFIRCLNVIEKIYK